MIRSVALFFLILGGVDQLGHYAHSVAEWETAIAKNNAVGLIFCGWEIALFVVELVKLRVKYDLASARHENARKRVARKAQRRRQPPVNLRR